MKIDVVEIQEDDIVMIHYSIGDLPPDAVDKHIDGLMDKLVTIFGKDQVALFPTRDENIWDFTIIRRIKKLSEL